MERRTPKDEVHLSSAEFVLHTGAGMRTISYNRLIIGDQVDCFH